MYDDYSTGVAPDPIAANVDAWDKIASCFTSTFPLDELPLAKYVHSSDCILDYGCGCARLISDLKSKGYCRVVGCDPSLQMCKMTRSTNPNTDVVWLDDPRNLGAVPSDFNAIFVVGVLSSIVPTVERESDISELVQHLLPGGLIIIGDFGCSEEPPYPERYSSALVEPFTFQTTDGICIHHFTLTELKNIVPANCVVIEARTVPVKTAYGHHLPGHIVVVQRG